MLPLRWTAVGSLVSLAWLLFSTCAQAASNVQVEDQVAVINDAPIDSDNNDDTPDIDTESTVDADTSFTGFALNGDIRPLLNYRDRDGRDGVSDSDTEARARIRLKGSFPISESLHLGARLAGRCTSSDCKPEWVFDGSVPDTNGLEGGQITFDELYTHFYKNDRFDITVGRQQTRFVLRSGVFARSLDRNDSANINVTWTDGMHATLRKRDGWTTHFILQRNSDEGSGSTRRAPLDFASSAAKNTYFVGLENTTGLGNVVQRSFDISYLPASLLKDGTQDGRREDYWAFVGRLAMRWPQRPDGPRMRAGIEIGYAPERPTSAAVQLDESVDGLAWDIALSYMDFRPSHSIGVNFGRTGAGWLLSPNFRPNEEMIEVRYQWRPPNFPTLEFRVRWRQDIEQKTGAVQKRDVFDSFLRITWQFSL